MRPMAEFGESVWYLPEFWPDGKIRQMEPKFFAGIWLGVCPRTDEALIGTKEGLVRANTVKRKPLETAFVADELLSVKITPAGMERRVMHGAGAEDDGEQDVVKLDRTEEAPGVKRMKIMKGDFDEIGFTDGCPGCNAVRTGKPSQNHTEACRRRVEGYLKESKQGQQRLDKAEARITEAFVRAGERIQAMASPMGTIAAVQQKAAGSMPGSSTDHPKDRAGDEAPGAESPGEAAADQPMDSGTTAGEAGTEGNGSSRMASGADDGTAGGGGGETAQDAAGPSPEPKPSLKRAGIGQAEGNRRRTMSNRRGEKRSSETEGTGEEEPQAKWQQIDAVEAKAHRARGPRSDGRRDRWDEDYKRADKEMRIEGHLRDMETIRSMLGCGQDLAEVYSPPRIASEASRMGMKSGFSLDFTTPEPDGYVWDFEKHECRKRALKLVRTVKPYMLVGSPECTPFSQIQNLNMRTSEGKEKVMKARARGEKHL